MSPVDAAQFLVWALNRMNVQGTSQIVEMLDGNQQLRQIAQQMGISDENIPQFQQDVRQYINDNMDNIGQQYIQQLLQNRQGGMQ